MNEIKAIITCPSCDDNMNMTSVTTREGHGVGIMRSYHFECWHCKTYLYIKRSEDSLGHKEVN